MKGIIDYLEYGMSINSLTTCKGYQDNMMVNIDYCECNRLLKNSRDSVGVNFLKNDHCSSDNNAVA